MGRNPVVLLRSVPFRLIFGVYFFTFATANLVDSVHAKRNALPPAHQSSTTEKLVCTTAVSTALCTYKDGQLARIFGSRPLAFGVPPQSYALFVLRDAVTVYASFTMPVSVAQWLSSAAASANLGAYAGVLRSEDVSLKASQMALPALAQFITTPIHLLGLDHYNRQGRVPLLRRLAAVRDSMAVAVPLRILRIVPAFGVGNVVNTSVRKAVLNRSLV